MTRKDKGISQSREGSGRVALFRASGLPHCYTLECNYYTGKRTNILYPEFHENYDYLNMNFEEEGIRDDLKMYDY